MIQFIKCYDTKYYYSGGVLRKLCRKYLFRLATNILYHVTVIFFKPS